MDLCRLPFDWQLLLLSRTPPRATGHKPVGPPARLFFKPQCCLCPIFFLSPGPIWRHPSPTCIHHPSCSHHPSCESIIYPSIRSQSHPYLSITPLHYFRAICIHPASLLPIYDPQSASLPESVMEVVSLQSPGTGRRPSEIIIVKGDSRSTEGDSREFNYFIIAPRSLKLDAFWYNGKKG